MTIDPKNTKISAVSQKEEIDHLLGNHKFARDHLVSRFLFTLNELQGRMLIVRRFQRLSFFNFFVIFN